MCYTIGCGGEMSCVVLPAVMSCVVVPAELPVVAQLVQRLPRLQSVVGLNPTRAALLYFVLGVVVPVGLAFA